MNPNASLTRDNTYLPLFNIYIVERNPRNKLNNEGFSNRAFLSLRVSVSYPVKCDIQTRSFSMFSRPTLFSIYIDIVY